MPSSKTAELPGSLSAVKVTGRIYFLQKRKREKTRINKQVGKD
jgi:hypothetical protein